MQCLSNLLLITCESKNEAKMKLNKVYCVGEL